MWPVIDLSVLIGWNILSSLNAVITNDEKNQIYKRSHDINLIFKSYKQKRSNLGFYTKMSPTIRDPLISWYPFGTQNHKMWWPVLAYCKGGIISEKC